MPPLLLQAGSSCRTSRGSPAHYLSTPTLINLVLKCVKFCALQAAEQLQDLKEFHRKMQEQMAESDPQAQAEEMLKLKTVKIQKAK